MPTNPKMLAEFAAAALAGGLEQGIESDMGSATRHSLNSWWHPPKKIAERAFDIAVAMENEYNRRIRQ